MKKLFLLFPVVAIACKDPRKVVPSLQPNFTTMDFNTVSMSIYYVKHTSAKGQVLNVDTIGFFCAPFMYMPGTENEQVFSCWQSIGKGDSGLIVKGKMDGEGAQANDTSLFMHPHRQGYYRTLQCCPFPYFEKVALGSTFSWDLRIGSHWGSELYPIKYEDTFSTTYKFADTVTLHTAVFNGLCYHYTADTRSIHGTSHGSWYLSNNQGIVRFTITNVDSSVFSYEMVAHTRNTDSMLFNKEFCQALLYHPYPH